MITLGNSLRGAVPELVLRKKSSTVAYKEYTQDNISQIFIVLSVDTYFCKWLM